MLGHLLDSGLAESAARAIGDAYSNYRANFDEITGRAGGSNADNCLN